MIVVDDPNILQNDFIRLLETTKKYVLEELESLDEQARKMDGDEFETVVYNNSLKASLNTSFEGHVTQTGSHAFPDIVAKRYFGIEVKMTTSDKWVSTGNSILESTRIDVVDRIYLFFGKFGGGIDIKFRSYQDCLYDIGVTHSPRYKIDMNLGEGKSIFSKMNIDYNLLRKEKNPIKTIKEYYKSLLQEGEELWWIDPQIEERTVNPIIKPFRKLSKDDQNKFIAECFVLFPEILGPISNTKYEKAATYLITEYNAVHASLRDSFSAGGKVDLEVKGVIIRQIPQVYERFMNVAKLIQKVINEIDEEKLLHYWSKKSLGETRIEIWKKLINSNAAFKNRKIKPSDIYEWGLR